MLVHECVDCGKISLNRIAADHDVATIEGLLVMMQTGNSSRRDEIHIPDLADDQELALVRLYGKLNEVQPVPSSQIG